VEAMVRLIIMSKQDPDVLIMAASALGTICRGASAAIHQRAAGAGALEELVRLIISSKDQGVLQGAAKALANICHGDSADIRHRVAGAGAVEALVQLIISSKGSGVLREAASALASLCSDHSASGIAPWPTSADGPAQISISALQARGLWRRW
jgi:hypothetical protein